MAKVGNLNLAVANPADPAVERATWLLLDLGSERQSGMMLTTLLSSVPKGEENMSTYTLFIICGIRGLLQPYKHNKLYIYLLR